MSEKARDANILHWLLAAASVVIIIAGMRSAQSLLVPFLVSAFLAVICAPAVEWLQKKGLPSALALTLVIVGVMLLFVVVISLASSSISEFIKNKAEYQALLVERVESVNLEAVDDWLVENGFGKERPIKKFLDDHLNIGTVMNWFTSFLSSLSGLFGNVFLVMLTLIFMLAEASSLPRKLVAITDGRRQLFDESSRVRDAIIHYMSLKTVVSLLTGVCAGVLVWALGVQFHVLWGLIAFLFNYVPNIGSFVAAFPPVLLALITKDFQSALLMGIGYGAINGIMGNFVEPRMMGRSLGLSTLVVFLSLVFWGWVLGPVGMLLSVPLTMIVKITLENFEQTRWMAILLGSNPEPVK